MTDIKNNFSDSSTEWHEIISRYSRVMSFTCLVLLRMGIHHNMVNHICMFAEKSTRWKSEQVRRWRAHAQSRTLREGLTITHSKLPAKLVWMFWVATQVPPGIWNNQSSSIYSQETTCQPTVSKPPLSFSRESNLIGPRVCFFAVTSESKTNFPKFTLHNTSRLLFWCNASGWDGLHFSHVFGLSWLWELLSVPEPPLKRTA